MAIQYRSQIVTLLKETFGLSDQEFDEQEEKWADWSNFTTRNMKDLEGLFRTSIKDVFKARAFTVLLAPRLDLLPFRWHKIGNSNNGNFLEMANVILTDFSAQLQDFIIRLLQFNIEFVLLSMNEKTNESSIKTLADYNKRILNLLGQLQDHDPRALSLFEHYQFNGPSPFFHPLPFYGPPPYFEIDDFSNYNPFRNLLSSKVNEKWKEITDAKMREIIMAEEAGKIQQRKGWGRALQKYMTHIALSLNYDRLPYSSVLLASQVDFVLNLPSSGSLITSYWWDIIRFTRMLGGKEHKNLCHKLVRCIVLEVRDNRSVFSVHTPERIENAKQMLEEFGGQDHELRAYLVRAISIGEEKLQEVVIANSALKEEENALLEAMR